MHNDCQTKINFASYVFSILHGCNILIYAPFTYTDISYESLRIAHIHGSLRFGHFYDRFQSCYELLRCIYDTIPRLPVVTDNYEQPTCMLRAFYGLLRVYYGMLLFIEAFTC